MQDYFFPSYIIETIKSTGETNVPLGHARNKIFNINKSKTMC